jgi:alkanesulfonate monooxygenase SsuD/methylene tetrahydromethanopterin reductase-like flavin-dependent oxidoreductase (luciferase family)
MFTMPAHPPERSLYDATQWDLQALRWADDYGYKEAWIGEHFTSPWEPVPAPDILIAQALLQTKNIKLAPGAHLLPFHHPAELAARVAYLDHLAQGRFMLGVGASGLPSDWQLFNVDGVNGETRTMMQEALEIMLRIWETGEEGGMRYEGNYWTVDVPPKGDKLWHHIRPYQQPHPPIGVASLSPHSSSLVHAAQRGFIPLSLNLSTHYIRTHADALEEGSAKAGKAFDRSTWRVVREVFVAETDEEARRLCLEGGMGRHMREYLVPLFKDFEFGQYLVDDPSMTDDDITVDYLVDNAWLVGSVETVTEKLGQLYSDVGGFGTVLVLGFDYSDNPEAWRQSLELFAKEVVPKVNERVGQPAAVPAGD